MGTSVAGVGRGDWRRHANGRCILSVEGEASVDEVQLRLARTQGELEATRAQLAGLMAAEEHWRVELEAAKEDAASCRSSLTHVQHQHEERMESTRRQISTLEDELAEARRLQRHAEQERAAVIAVLGRRARKQLHADSE
jgi:septation ring formation regulator EzrA